MKKNIILVGVGGQGIILASKLIAQSAMDMGLFAKTAETIGMAQRGGSVISHVRIGQDIHSPLVPQKQADLIIGFEPAETVRALPYLKENGTVIVSDHAVKPVTDSLLDSNYRGQEMLDYLEKKVDNLIVVNTEAICKTCGSSKIVNTSLLGVATATEALGIGVEQMEKTIRENMKEKYVDMNVKALYEGSKVASK